MEASFIKQEDCQTISRRNSTRPFEYRAGSYENVVLARNNGDKNVMRRPALDKFVVITLRLRIPLPTDELETGSD
jgi:hypothetical protein